MGTAKSPGRSLLSAVGAGIFGLFARGKRPSNGGNASALSESPAQPALPGAPTGQVKGNGRGRVPRIAAPAQSVVRNGEEVR